MRFGRMRRPAVAIAAALGLQGASSAAFAAPGQLFPVPSHLVPMVVAAAFMLPAAMAGVLSVMRRAGRGRGAIVGAGLAVAAIAAVAFIDPGLLTARRV